jgi:dipeptidyl aminopeptidase/acylaminoacyl peptidase
MGSMRSTLRPRNPGWCCRGGGEAFFLEPGTLIFARDDNLLAQPFDPEKMELSSTPRPIAAGVYYSKIRGYINGGASSRGGLIYQLITPPKRYKLAWMDLRGERTLLPVEPEAIADLETRVSPDGRRAAISIFGGREEQWVAVVDLERGIRTILSDPAVTFTFGLLWGPEGQSIITSEDRDDKRNLIRFPLAGGPGTPFFQAESGVEISAASITPDGQAVLFVQQSLRDKIPDIFSVNIDGSGPATRFMQTPEGEWKPLLSPAGDFVAYVARSEDDPGATLKVVPFPTPKASIQVSLTPVAGESFYWIDQNELAWTDVARRVWSATIEVKDGRIDVGAPKPMFDGKPLDAQVELLDYHIASKRFLIAVEDEPREDPRLIVVSDWRQDGAGAAPTQR